MDARDFTITVDCYSGYRGEETPRALTIGERRVIVEEVLDRWLAPDHRYFKLLGDDGIEYIIRQEVSSGIWILWSTNPRGTTSP